MAVFSRIKSWVSNEVLTASDLNAEFNNLLNNTKPQSIEDYSADTATMQITSDPGGVGTESLPTTLAGEIERLRYVIKRIVGQAQWYVNAGRSLAAGALSVQTADLAANAVTTAKITDANVTTAKLADGSVTPAKINLGAQISSSCGLFSMASTTATNVTNLSVSFTASGTKSVFIEIMPDSSGSSNTSQFYASRQAEDCGMNIYILRSGTYISKTTLRNLVVGSGGFSEIHVPPVLKVKDTPSAGTYTYTVQVESTSAGSSPNVGVSFAVLMVYEL